MAGGRLTVHQKSGHFGGVAVGGGLMRSLKGYIKFESHTDSFH